MVSSSGRVNGKDEIFQNLKTIKNEIKKTSEKVVKKIGKEDKVYI